MQTTSRLRRQNYDLLRHARGFPAPFAGALPPLEAERIVYQAVPEDSPCLDRSLAELAFRRQTGTTVIGLIRHERTLFGPTADLRLERGDTLILLGEPEAVARAREFLHGHPV